MEVDTFGVRPICRLHFGQTFQNFPSLIVKHGPEKKGLNNVLKMHFVVLKSSYFAPKGFKMLFQQEKVGSKLV